MRIGSVNSILILGTQEQNVGEGIMPKTATRVDVGLMQDALLDKKSPGKRHGVLNLQLEDNHVAGPSSYPPPMHCLLGADTSLSADAPNCNLNSNANQFPSLEKVCKRSELLKDIH